MGHYLSEMPGEPARQSTTQSGYNPENRKLMDMFYGGEYPGTGTACPRCGASLKWNWTNVDNLLLHIKWHQNLESIVSHQGKMYPGLPV